MIMHMDNSCRVFNILEILRLILDSLADDKKSLLHLAICSRTLADPSLDYLWADMDSFAPLAPLLPKTLLELLWDPIFRPALSLGIPCPPVDEWKRFDTYAHRVRRIRVRPGKEFQDRALYQNLVRIRPVTDLFPRLLSLHCHLVDDLTPGIKLFPLSLRSLTIFNGTPFDARAELAVYQAARDAPHLEKLRIVGAYRLVPGVEPQPLDFAHLHTVHFASNLVRVADVRSFWRLFCTSHVRNLRIRLRDCLEFFQLDERDTPSSFPHVESIYIDDGPSVAVAILSRVSSPRIQTVTIGERDCFASVADYGKLFTLLAQRQPPIRSLRVKMGCLHAVYSDFILGFLTALDPLIQAGLAGLRLELPLDSTCRATEEIASKLRPDAWPTLERFEFVQLGYPSPSP